jgi:hypothetical protein
MKKQLHTTVTCCLSFSVLVEFVAARRRAAGGLRGGSGNTGLDWYVEK